MDQTFSVRDLIEILSLCPLDYKIVIAKDGSSDFLEKITKDSNTKEVILLA